MGDFGANPSAWTSAAGKPSLLEFFDAVLFETEAEVVGGRAAARARKSGGGMTCCAASCAGSLIREISFGVEKD